MDAKTPIANNSLQLMSHAVTERNTLAQAQRSQQQECNESISKALFYSAAGHQRDT